MTKKMFVFTLLTVLALFTIFSDQKKGVKDTVTSYYQDIQIDFENQWALIIGISDYSRIKGLNNAAYEAQKLGKLLIAKYGFNPRRSRLPYRRVEHLFNKDATYEAIIERLDWYRDNLKKEDWLFIYFSGHGYVDRNGIGYWLPYNVGDDLKISRRMKGEEIINKSSKKILNYVMVKFLEKCKAKHIFVVADSCYAGEIFSEFKGGELPAQLIKEKSRQLLTAGSSVVSDPSHFTNFLIDFLNNNNQPYLIGSTIISKAKENLGKNLAPRGGYVPKTGSKGGEFVFKLKDFEPPPGTEPVSVEKYKKEIQAAKIKKEWDEWQQNFRTSFQRVKELEENRDLSVRSKIEAWKEVLKTFNKRNPFSDEDEQLRKYVKERIAYLERKTRDHKPIKPEVAKPPVVSEEIHSNPFGKKINKKAKRIYKNSKGFWEADYGDGIIMVYIPAGEFRMGSNDGHYDVKPPHTVYLDGYWMGKTEVTVKQYMEFVCETTSHYPEWLEKGSKKNIESGNDDYYKRFGSALSDNNYPIVGISWHDASAYCDWLSEKTGLRFKIPSEAQWEKAARGTDSRIYPWGNSQLLGEKVNFADKQEWIKEKDSHADKFIDDGYGYTAPVGSYPQGASPYGLLDMAGNVGEMCSDFYGKNYYSSAPKKNPTGPISGSARVMRGGGWLSLAWGLRCTNRHGFMISIRPFILGFRLCQEN